MYEVLINGKTLYYPASKDYAIYDVELEPETGLAGEFEFNVPSSNPMYSEIKQGAVITILRDNVEYWRGEVKETSIDLSKVMNVYCLEDLSWLADEFIFPEAIFDETYRERFEAAIAAYNSGRPSDRQFTAGYLTNVNSSADCAWITEYDQSILDCIRTCIAGEDGLLKVRRVTQNGSVTRYIDCVKLADYGVLATQPIRFGVNLLKYVEEMDLENFTNALTPYGAETDVQIYEDYNQRLAGTPIENSASIAAYGRHSKAVIFDTDDLTTLNNLAQSYLTRYSQPQLTLKISAVDLADLTEGVSHYEIGDAIRIIAEPFAIDQDMYLTKQKIDLQDPSRNDVTLSSYVRRGSTLTSQSNNTAKEVKKLPSKSAILDAAKRNAYEILTGDNCGNISFVKNANDQIIELRIANNTDFDHATKAWRWNINGLAYLHRDYYTDNWTVGLAATMDGGIVADFVTSGTMYANRIKGGTLTLGGAADGNGVCSVQDANAIECVRIDKDGIAVNKGTIAGLTVEAAEKGLSFNAPISGEDCYFKVSAWGGFTSGRELANSWARMDYVSAWGMLKVDYGGTDSSLYGIIVTAAGNNTYNDPGSSYSYIHADGIHVVSDKRSKKDIKNLDDVDFILKLRPVSFKYIEGDTNKKHYGFIAQEVLKEIPDNSVVEKSDELYSLNYQELIAPIIKTIQKQQAEIDSLKEEIRELKGER